MKKIALTLTALAAFTGSAIAADMAPRYAKAPAPIAVAVAPSWTGFWLSGGIGYGMQQYQHTEYDPAGVISSVGQDVGGKGWLGKVGVGYDYQFMGNYVMGAFADYTFSNVGGQGSFSNSVTSGSSYVFTGQFKNDWSWAAGARIGYVALPGLLTYFNGGYTQAHFKGVNYYDGDLNNNFGALSGPVLGSQTRGGYFLGGGTEYAVSQIPGLFWKNEVRFSSFGSKSYNQICTVAPASDCGGAGTLHSIQNSRVYQQAATTELVYRFNWGGAVVAKY